MRVTLPAVLPYLCVYLPTLNLFPNHLETLGDLFSAPRRPEHGAGTKVPMHETCIITPYFPSAPPSYASAPSGGGAPQSRATAQKATTQVERPASPGAIMGNVKDGDIVMDEPSSMSVRLGIRRSRSGTRSNFHASRRSEITLIWFVVAA